MLFWGENPGNAKGFIAEGGEAAISIPCCGGVKLDEVATLPPDVRRRVDVVAPAGL